MFFFLLLGVLYVVGQIHRNLSNVGLCARVGKYINKSDKNNLRNKILMELRTYRFAVGFKKEQKNIYKYI